MNIKANIIFDKTKNSIKIKSIIEKKIITSSLNKANLIIVIGGDGFMLQSLKKLHKYNISFYGINSGNYGFLMNKFSYKNFVKNLTNSKIVKIHPLQMVVKIKKIN